ALRPSIVGSEITIRRDANVHVPTSKLPSALISDLKHMASIANPEFYRKQAMRVSTFGEPRVVVRFVDDGRELTIARGLFDEARTRLELAGFRVRIRSSRRKRESIEAEFLAELRPEQKEALSAIDNHDIGVLVAPPGTGKTVIACALIAQRQVATAIIVPTRELLSQWRSRLSEFLSVADDQIGQLGGGRRKITGIIDLIMMRSISHRNADPSVLNRYGQIIIDECHGAAAPAAEAALNQVDAPKWVGLTATPYRADQLNGLITMQCGPIRFNMSKTTPEEATPDSVSGSTPPSSHSPRRTLQVHRTEFTTDAPGSGGPSMPDLYTELAADEKRTALIIEEVIARSEERRG